MDFQRDKAAPSSENPTHDHSDAYHQTSIENQTPEFILKLRNHMRTEHGAGDGWVYGVGRDLLAESHNLNHGRDAFGVEL